MRKTVKIDLSSDRLIGVAADLVEEHNYIGALKMLNKNADLNGNDGDAYMLYAEIFDDIGLHEKCINAWFKFMDCCGEEDLSDAYEGLAVSYMNLGNEHFSAYYYNQLLLGADDVDAEMRREIMDSFLRREPNPLKFVYPPEIADCSDIISDGIDKMQSGEFAAAVDEFCKVDEENPAYVSARNYIAMCDIICDKNEEAEAECLEILKKRPDSVQALTTLAAVKTEQKKVEESRELARRLLKLDVKSSDDIYKIATVCCENKMHEEAFNMFSKLEGELAYDSTLLYFKAVSAFNCGRYEDSFDAFDRMLTLNPDAVTARYHYSRARSAAENGKDEELSYFYRMPQSDRESSLKILASFAKLKDAEARALAENVDITDCILWAFDEREGSDEGELRFLATICAIKAGMYGLVEDILLDAFLPDGLKLRTLTFLGERNTEAVYSVVICHMLKSIAFRPLKIGRSKRKAFVRAYSSLTAHFGIIHESYGEKFARTAEAVYGELESRGLLASPLDADALGAVIYFKSGVDEPKVKREELSDFFKASERKISELLEIL